MEKPRKPKVDLLPATTIAREKRAEKERDKTTIAQIYLLFRVPDIPELNSLHSTRHTQQQQQQ